MENLTNLSYLDLWQNRLTEVPSFIQKLTKLQGLDLENNYIGAAYANHNIYQDPKYAERNEKYSGTWRGRNRENTACEVFVSISYNWLFKCSIIMSAF